MAADSGAGYKKIRPEKHYVTPLANRNTLFYVQRDPNANTVMYDLNTNANGTLDVENPLHVYWIKYNEHGQKEELNYIQRKFAYGVTVKQKDGDDYDIRFVSYKKFPMSLMKDVDGKYHIFALIANKQIILKNLFVRVEGGSFWIPNILYVEVKGTDPLTGKEITDRFKP
jgi:hypothetical protein